MSIRLAKEADADALLGIYGPYIRDTHISFEYEVPTNEAFKERVISTSSVFPWLVCLSDDKIVGYAYAGKHRDRTAYQWSCDATVYLSPSVLGKGLGRILYETLFEILRLQGYYNVFAGIGLPNDTSVAFHKKLGFEEIGIYKNVGFKNNKWHDTIWLQLSLSTYNDQPLLPKKITEIINTGPCIRIMSQAMAKLKLKIH